MRVPLVACAAALCAASFAQDFTDVHVEKVLNQYRFTEGPAWSPDEFLIFSDVPGNAIHKWIPGQKPEMFRSSSNGANGNAFDPQGRLYTCESHTRRVTRTDRKGKVEVLAERWQGKRFNAPNDIAVRRDGNVYFTDPAFGNQADTRELDFYGVYHISPKGELALIAKPRGRPNGVALPANGRILYVANSDERTVTAWDLDRAGAASNERVIVRGIEGVPDGLRLDEKGNLYVAAKSVYVYSPEGKQLTAIPLPETPSNLTFGDPDLQTLYVTARTAVYRIRLDVKGASQH